MWLFMDFYSEFIIGIFNLFLQIEHVTAEIAPVLTAFIFYNIIGKLYNPKSQVIVVKITYFCEVYQLLRFLFSIKFFKVKSQENEYLEDGKENISAIARLFHKSVDGSRFLFETNNMVIFCSNHDFTILSN